MNRTLNLTLALAAGLLGGLLSNYLTPTPVLAQTQSPAPVSKEIRAERFTLVNEDGVVLGTFGIDHGVLVNGKLRGNPMIKLFDENGHHEIWSAGGLGFRPLSQR
jgi:hypothetical protein